MSWDLFIQDIPADADSVQDIPDDFSPRSLGSRAEVIRHILEVVPTANFSDPAWGSFEDPSFSVAFNLGDEEELSSFALHVRGGDEAVGLVADLLHRNGWRAFDPQSDSGIFDTSGAAKSLAKWREYRDCVVGLDGPEK
jgi:hypothetical protein